MAMCLQLRSSRAPRLTTPPRSSSSFEVGIVCGLYGSPGLAYSSSLYSSLLIGPPSPAMNSRRLMTIRKGALMGIERHPAFAHRHPGPRLLGGMRSRALALWSLLFRAQPRASFRGDGFGAT
jgi:hypothetical protein